MKISEIISEIVNDFKKNNINNPQLEALAIASFVLKITPEKIIGHSEKKINPQSIKKIRKIYKKRLENWPLAYLIGKKNFYNLEFKVDKNVLIPRPESELIIDEVLKNDFSKEKTIIIDVGTGSGCLIITLADLLKKDGNICFLAIDKSRKALKIARQNAKKHNLRDKIKFIKGNLLKPIDKKIIEKETNIIIIANLPYLTKKEIRNSASIKKEPRKALYGGRDGLKYYEKLWKQIKKLKNKNSKIIVYQEINDWQVENLEKIITKKMKPTKPHSKITEDLFKQRRLIITTLE
ncbi:MAG: peptide chain release factor N(5)-glutamine methyltransferase [Patescibacteria group bacterium]|jgi:release factor glutamine methyltransferase